MKNLQNFKYPSLVKPLSVHWYAIKHRLPRPFRRQAPLGPAAVVSVEARETIVSDELVRQTGDAALVVGNTGLEEARTDVAENWGWDRCDTCRYHYNMGHATLVSEFYRHYYAVYRQFMQADYYKVFIVVIRIQSVSWRFQMCDVLCVSTIQQTFLGLK